MKTLTRSWIRANPPVFFGSAALLVLLLIYTWQDPERAETLFSDVNSWIVDKAGWFLVMSVAFYLVFVVYIALSRFGTIRLGPDHSRPDYGYAAWFSMLFAAGMGIGLMFFGVAEPLMHYIDPPQGEGQTVEAARESMRITFFHWGIHAWAIYSVVALSLAYFAYRHNLPLTIRSSLYPLIGDRIYGPIGDAVDTFAVLGTLFGVATSLGLGAVQINTGLNLLFGMEVSTGMQMVLIVVITAVATGSVCLGLDRGIKRLSVFNMILAVFLLGFVLVFGPTVFLLQTLVQNTGNYISGLFHDTFNLYAYEPTGWIGGWTLFYWGWWIAWSPFVGMFIARVSRGRTIREFAGGALLLPIGFTAIWMTFFGDTALHMVMMQGVEGLVEAVSENEAVALFRFFDNLPLSSVMSFLAIVLVATFFVTSADSGSLVVDMLTSAADGKSPVWQRLFWAVLQGLIAAVLLWMGGLKALQTATIASALPFAAIMILMCIGLLRALRLDSLRQSVLSDNLEVHSADGGPLPWKKRLHLITGTPDRREVSHFIRHTARPALEAVATEFTRQGVAASVTEPGTRSIVLAVDHDSTNQFLYAINSVAYDSATPDATDEAAHQPEATDNHRAEVHLSTGGQDYDVMGWSEEMIINDVINQYERFRRFLDRAQT